MERNKRKIGRWLGVLAAILVPAIATAALTIPNSFTSGTVIKSADVNANFAAVATAVSSDETSIVSLQNAVAALQNVTNSLQTSVTSLQSTVTSLQSTVTSQASTIASLQSTVSGLSSSVAASPQIIGFALAEAGSLVSYGGAGTTSVINDYSYTGYMELTFNGKYPSTINANRVMIMATPFAYDYGAVDTEVLSASPTSITIIVYQWMSSTLTSLNGYFYVALIAQP
jgi:hypothetical protein